MCEAIRGWGKGGGGGGKNPGARYLIDDYQLLLVS